MNVTELFAEVLVYLPHRQLRERELGDLSMSHVHQIGFGSVFAEMLNSREDHLYRMVLNASFALWSLTLEI